MFSMNILRVVRRTLITTLVFECLAIIGSVPLDEALGLRSLLIGFQIQWAQWQGALGLAALVASFFFILECVIYLKNSDINFSRPSVSRLSE